MESILPMRPNVLIMAGSFSQGGSERQAVQVARLLHESGRYRIHMACLDGRGALRGEAERLGIGPIPEFPLTSFYDLNMAVQVRRCVQFLREEKIDLIQTFDFYTNVFGMIAGACARVPARIAAKRETDGIRSAAQNFVERRAFELAHVVVANAEEVRRQLVRDGVPTDKIETIYNGVDMERLTPPASLRRAETLAQLGLPQDRRFVTIVANMRHAMKDQATFLRAAKRLHADVPDAAFVLAGEGELLEQWRTLAAQLGLEQNTFFLGRCAHVAELLAVSDVCVLSSKGVEGFSNSVIEYMAAARPVVATDIGGAREAITEGETGYIVAPEDDERMAERLLSLLADPARARRMGERGREVAQQKFSCEAQRERTEELYCRLLAKARRTRPHPAAAPPPTRVLMVAPSLDILGGQSVQAASLLARLQAEPSLEVTFLPINPRLPGPFSNVQKIKYVRTLVTAMLYWASLIRHVRSCDVLHIFSASYFSFLLAPTPALLVAKLYGKKSLLNYHSGEAEDHLRRWRHTAIPTLRMADVIAVPSGYLVDVFAQFGLSACAVFNIVETEEFRFRERRPLRPIFLSNRNLEALYNVDCTLRAFARIQQRYPEAQLSIAGDGSRRAHLENLVRELGLLNVRFLGRIEHARMHELYEAADIYLNSPNIDNMPVSILEAFASGLPVVTTDAGGIPYIVTDGETGVLVPRDDDAAMAAGILRLLEDTDFAARLASAARAECRKYDWSAIRNGWLELYNTPARKCRRVSAARTRQRPG